MACVGMAAVLAQPVSWADVWDHEESKVFLPGIKEILPFSINSQSLSKSLFLFHLFDFYRYRWDFFFFLFGCFWLGRRRLGETKGCGLGWEFWFEERLRYVCFIHRLCRWRFLGEKERLRYVCINHRMCRWRFFGEGNVGKRRKKGIFFRLADAPRRCKANYFFLNRGKIQL